MDVVAWITGLVLIAGFGMAGMAKLTGQPLVMATAVRLGFTPSQFKVVGAAEMAGAGGVLIGLLNDGLEWLGTVAGLGLAVSGLLAFVFHRRANDDMSDSVPALVLAAVAAVHTVALAAA